MHDPKDTFWEQYGHFVGCTVRESNSAVGIVTGVTNDGEPMLHIRRRNGNIDKRKPSEVHKTCACGKRALDSNGKVCPGHENCKPLACAPPEPEECPGPHDDGPLNYCPTCSWQREQVAKATFAESNDEVAIARLTRAMRAADSAFEKVGGTTRHYVHECLLPAMKERGVWLIVTEEQPDAE